MFKIMINKTYMVFIKKEKCSFFSNELTFKILVTKLHLYDMV